MRKRMILLSAFILTLHIFLGIAMMGIAHAKDVIITVDNINTAINIPTTKINNIPYVPLRPALEALGWSVKWDSLQRSINCFKGKEHITFKTNSNYAFINGEQHILDSYPIIINGTTYIQSKLLAIEFGVKVRWNKTDNLIITPISINGNIAVNGNGNIVVAGNGILVNIIEPYGIDTVYNMLDSADNLLSSNLINSALVKYKGILGNLSYEENPKVYAHIMNNMGNAYCIKAGISNMHMNTINAIDSYKKALDIYEATHEKLRCSITRNNLGNAYKLLWEVTGNKEDLKLAVKEYQIASRTSWPDANLMEFAALQYNLGTAYAESGQNELSKTSLSEAQKIYTSFLKIYSLEDTPLQSAFIQQKLGDIHKTLSNMLPTDENITSSIFAYKEALKAYTIESYPRDYARIQQCLGDILKIQMESSNYETQIEMIDATYRESLIIFTLERYPIDYARVNYSLGNLFIYMAERKKDSKYLTFAMSAYKEALKVFSNEDYPAYNRIINERIRQYENLKYSF